MPINPLWLNVDRALIIKNAYKTLTSPKMCHDISTVD